MDFSSCKIDDYIEEVEKCMVMLRHKFEEEKNEITNSQKKVTNLLNSFFEKENEVYTVIEPMKITLSNNSILDTIFKEDTQNAFLFSEDREKKKKRLAAERKAEYNTYLEKKEQEILDKRKVYEEMSTTPTPRSLLESVNYETVLAKRKEEELRFRQLNCAEPSLREKVNNQAESEKINHHEYNRKFSPAKINSDRKFLVKSHQDSSLSTSSQNVSYSQMSTVKTRPLTAEELHIHRTGGGGEPVRDFLGNIITSRRFRETAPVLQLPSFKQPTFDKKSSYREELAKQIEEKKLLSTLEKQKALETEMKIAERIEEQRKQMQIEYENELKSNNKMKEKRQQERVKQLEEFQKNDANLRQKVKENKIIEKRQADVKEITPDLRSTSPPVPAVRSKVIFEKVVSPVHSAPKILTDAPVKPENVFSSLAEIRRKILQERQNFNERESYEVMNRRTVPNVTNEDDYDIGDISEQIENLKA